MKREHSAKSTVGNELGPVMNSESGARHGGSPQECIDLEEPQVARWQTGEGLTVEASL